MSVRLLYLWIEQVVNHFKFTALSAFLPCCLMAPLAQANPLTLGGGLLYSQSPYKSGQDRYYPLPVINYEGDSFYIRSLQAGYFLWKDPQDQLSLTVIGSPQNYDPDDADDADMKSLNKRRMTLMGGLAYRHSADWGIVRTTLAGDMLDNSNGIIWDVAYLYRFEVGQFSLTPGIGALWSSARQNRYYYGVTPNESQRSGVDSYDPDSSWSPYLELSAGWKISENWNAMLSGRYLRPGSEIKDSPMVDEKAQMLLFTGVSYTF
ncbi:MipA/OmpV family protein [Erwinia pyrifoliae]|uniref:MipA/OmpV family protein n=1 Tax=Erwinia pyrifoliae TaxID=79967 RepID=A0ABY5XC54_ERWPY|nr:MipA/OmpV family protein [Erwinia pyrifoliae]AUX72878.1 MipA/OmpV family protein [Erwinia pyrifoliae]MCA8876853.1 MipA/OmpV family protein [Erwinia pyrifoliae]MCT2387010.1 MipA/OmpV family protein [Erwinia pyrifoliae]MCU8587391.1 MipA/OmpV family protein [Erwinia pyrifoliae]UWS34957.1 MipA/OmpV family protein [Erwinia pyrifoliae]